MGIQIDYNRANKLGTTAVVYARYSSHSQGEQSIEGQLSAARAYANARDYKIIHEYVDRAMTGRNDNRDEFQKMLSDCSKRQFQVIIVWKVDRFGRNREEITFNKYRAKKNGVRVEYVAETMPDGPEGVILESVLEGMAEYYSLQLSQNIRRGYLENAKKCKYAGGQVPMGYRLTADKSYELDPDTAMIVRRIFTMYAEGYTVSEITDKLNSEGLKNARGRSFSKNSMWHLLKSEIYTGVFDFKQGTIRVEDGVPAIIDKETFEKVQQKLISNRRAPTRRWSRNEYLLSDKLFCGKCGAPMVGECGTSGTGVKYDYYLCTNHKKTKTCDRKAIRRDMLEEYVIQHAVTMIMDDELLDFITDSTWQYYLAKNASADKLTILKRELTDVEKGIANLVRAIETGLPITDAMKDRITELESQKAALASAIAEAELENSLSLTRNHIAHFLYKFRKLDFSDRACQKRLIDIFINSIYIDDDYITTNYNFGGGSSTVTFSEFLAFKASGGFANCALCSTIRKKPLISAVSYLLFCF